MPYRRTPAVEQQQLELRHRLLAEATALVAEGGWGACTVAAVARRTGVATGTVYGYVPGKSALLAEVFRAAAAREVEAGLDARRRAREDPAACTCRLVTAMVEGFAERAARAPRLAHALLVEPVDVAVEAERRTFREAWADLIAETVRDGVERGDVPTQDPRVTGAALLGAAAEVLVQPLAAGAVGPSSPDGPLDYDAVVQSLSQLARRSLGGTHDHHP